MLLHGLFKQDVCNQSRHREQNVSELRVFDKQDVCNQNRHREEDVPELRVFEEEDPINNKMIFSKLCEVSKLMFSGFA